MELRVNSQHVAREHRNGRIRSRARCGGSISMSALAVVMFAPVESASFASAGREAQIASGCVPIILPRFGQWSQVLIAVNRADRCPIPGRRLIEALVEMGLLGDN